jgi:hypothetical protein
MVDRGEVLQADLWAFDTGSSLGWWFPVVCDGTAPPPRVGHVACVVGDRMFIHGGVGEECTLGDMWSMSLAATFGAAADAGGVSGGGGSGGGGSSGGGGGGKVPGTSDPLTGHYSVRWEQIVPRGLVGPGPVFDHAAVPHPGCVSSGAACPVRGGLPAQCACVRVRMCVCGGAHL